MIGIWCDGITEKAEKFNPWGNNEVTSSRTLVTLLLVLGPRMLAISILSPHFAELGASRRIS